MMHTIRRLFAKSQRTFLLGLTLVIVDGTVLAQEGPPASEETPTTTTLSNVVPSTTSTSLPPKPKLTKPKMPTTTTQPEAPSPNSQESKSELENLPRPSLKRPKPIPLENLDCNKLAADVRAQSFRCLNEVVHTRRHECCGLLNDYYLEQSEAIAVCQAQLKLVHKELLEAEKKKFSQQPSACE